MAGEEEEEEEKTYPAADLKKTAAVAAIGAGVEFGWAIQLSLLTPYVQQLGVPHKWAPLFWFAGPFSGTVVQPILGFLSDRSSSRFGRRRPFLAAYVALAALAAFLMAFAADLGRVLGGSDVNKTRAAAIAAFGVGILLLECGNIAIYTHCAAFLGDLTAGNPKGTRTATALFSFFMAVGGVLGYAAGLYTHLHRMFPFALTKACDVYCANLKSCLFLSVALLLLTSLFALFYVPDKPQTTETAVPTLPLSGIMKALKEVKRPMWMLLVVTSLNWVAWFPFMLYNTDWMGREIYGGDDDGSKKVYDEGVRMGALGLMVNAVVQAMASLGVEWMGGKMGGANRLWGAANFLLGVCLAMTVAVTKQPVVSHRTTGALVLFALLGVPMAATYCVPFAMAAIMSTETGAGQAFSMGLVNFAIQMPQMVISVGAGPFDEAFGGGNLPAFAAGAVVAALSGIAALLLLPSSLPSHTTTTTTTTT